MFEVNAITPDLFSGTRQEGLRLFFFLDDTALSWISFVSFAKEFNGHLSALITYRHARVRWVRCGSSLRSAAALRVARDRSGRRPRRSRRRATASAPPSVAHAPLSQPVVTHRSASDMCTARMFERVFALQTSALLSLWNQRYWCCFQQTEVLGAS